MPPAWSDQLQAHVGVPPSGTDFGLTAAGASGNKVFGQYISSNETGVGLVDLTTGEVSRLSSFGPDAGGLNWINVELPWVVWDQQDSNSQPGWTLVAFNVNTHERLVLSADPAAPGQQVRGGVPPYPVIKNGRVAWSEAMAPSGDGKPQSRIVLYDLGARSSHTIVGGATVSAPVFAGGDLIWGLQGADKSFSFQAVLADTLQPVHLGLQPSGIGSIQYVAGSNDYLAWSSADFETLSVFHLTTGVESRFAAVPDLLHRVQFPALTGDYAVWYTGDRFSVMDLTNGAAFDVYGSATVGEGVIAFAQPVGAVVKGQISSSRIGEVQISQVPHLTRTACTP